MGEKFESFLKDNVEHLKQGRIEVFTPQSYLEKRINEIEGDKVKIFGLVPYKYYRKPSDEKPCHIGVFTIPSIATFYPSNIEENVKDDIWGANIGNENEYTKLTFIENGPIYEPFIVENLDNVMLFLGMLFDGSIDNNIPYSLLSRMWIKNMAMNNTNLAIPGSVAGLIIRELCRYKKNRNIPFSIVYGKDPTIPQTHYIFISIRNICAANSVFAALAFEDMNAMLDSSLNMTLDEREQNISPLEQIIKM